MSENVLRIRDLSVNYQTDRGVLEAIRHVNLDIPKGSIVGVVGESGCGKSTLITSIIRQLDDNADIPNGSIEFEKQDLLKLSLDKMRNISGTKLSIIFQDPMSTLNPVLSIGRQMIDIQYRDKISKKRKKQRSIDMLTKVGIPDPRNQLNQYPYELSGGMQQRVSIAMALQAGPSLLIADEPTTALDTTLEVQILKLLKELQEEMGCSILFVSHHLGVIAELCDHVVVMYAGEIVEQGSTYEIFNNPAHPYTVKLLECDPASISKKQNLLPTIPGEIPDLINLSGGCIFKNRCDQSIERCDKVTPILNKFDTHHFVSCHLIES
ncbi:MAG: peptide ABC transporter ATP-binding protein [Candidatus Marinimicrobia bacterium]|jgi:oligopeptide/dipeptide ABC transporter ATP-binding protein|nr:peptide ABC transporter ATP-binding protein [Candidatus Neomarinimicrobiota bacterium]|tara:strand:- start:2155 stop:3123 length:969 start_codon:yes stop_codon:yes gene_type:complete